MMISFRAILRNLVFTFASCTVSLSAFAAVYDTGFNTDPSRIDDPDYYKHQTPTGSEIKELYNRYESMRDKSLAALPTEFGALIENVHEYMQATSVQENKDSKFYIGPNGIKNGEEFDLDRDSLPRKLVRLSFCFGFDPLIFTGLIRQESHFSRWVVSHTGASGFTQVTDDNLAEVSEQLGLLGPGFYGSDNEGNNAPDIFRSYIDCYLGPDKEWVNVWEAGIVPKGAGAYKNGNTGKNRKWAYIKKTKDWLNEDADRNLIYGAIQLKLYLGHYGSYTKALKRYNVSHASIYSNNVYGFYSRMEEGLQKRLENYKRLALAYINLKSFVYDFDDYRCSVPAEAVQKDMTFLDTIQGLYKPQEIEFMLENNWTSLGYCRSEAQDI